MVYGRRDKRPLKQADEYDAFTSARRRYKWRSGEIKDIKRRAHKAERRKSREQARRHDE